MTPEEQAYQQTREFRSLILKEVGKLELGASQPIDRIQTTQRTRHINVKGAGSPPNQHYPQTPS